MAGLRTAFNSFTGLLRTSFGLWGKNSRIIAMVRMAQPATNAKAERQPASWPSQVASGLPNSMAPVMPSITRLTALARPLGGTSEAAINDITPKYAPCGMPDKKRLSIISP